MNCAQRTSKVVQILAIIGILVCFVFNVVAIYKAADETWFVYCQDCKRYGGHKECGDSCCTNCTWKDGVFFYILRGYTLLFCLFALAAEFRLELFDEYVKMCSFYTPRGFWQMFLGLMTVQANTVPRDRTAEMWADAFGYFLFVIGIIHLVLGCMCFKEYSKEERDAQHEKYHPSQPSQVNAGPSQI